MRVGEEGRRRRGKYESRGGGEEGMRVGEEERRGGGE